MYRGRRLLHRLMTNCNLPGVAVRTPPTPFRGQLAELPGPGIGSQLSDLSARHIEPMRLRAPLHKEQYEPWLNIPNLHNIITRWIFERCQRGGLCVAEQRARSSQMSRSFMLDNQSDVFMLSTTVVSSSCHFLGAI